MQSCEIDSAIQSSLDDSRSRTNDGVGSHLSGEPQELSLTACAEPVQGAPARRLSMFFFELEKLRSAHYAVDGLRTEMAARGRSEHQSYVGKRNVGSAVDADLQSG